MNKYKELSEANAHCINGDCKGCPFQDQKEKCSNRESKNLEAFETFVTMMRSLTKEREVENG